jgi:hypothetical protein
VRLAAERDAEARRAAKDPPSGPHLSELVRQIDSATSVSDVLSATVNCAASGGAHAALFVGPGFDRWTGGGVASNGVTLEGGQAALNSAMTSAQVVTEDDRSIAAPLVLDGTPVAVLYVEQDVPSGGAWIDSVEVLARCASARLGYLTALRAAQAHQRLGSGVTAAAGLRSESPSEDPEQSARRYARLLVSEIKLYNEAAVREGRAHRDLSRRLAAEIERARRLYEERVSSTVSGRSQYFQQELVQTLAGGDSSLLG